VRNDNDKEDILRAEEAINQLGEEMIRLSQTNAATVETRQKLEEALVLLRNMRNSLVNTNADLKQESARLLAALQEAGNSVRSADEALAKSAARLEQAVAKVEAITNALNVINRGVLAVEDRVKTLANYVVILAGPAEKNQKDMEARLDAISQALRAYPDNP
jgi:chromosome segregation ATPase